ncbi:MAG: AraC family transcriptional regulator [Ekhidna sp.]
MVSKFIPDINKVYFINKYTIFHIMDGAGLIQVDFKNYDDWRDKIIYLEPGQYIKFFSDNFSVRKIEFEDEAFFKNKEVRVLFKHLISLGYIDFEECAECQQYLSSTVLSPEVGNIIDVSSQQWFWQNPFQASKEEYHIIFDIKEVIDREFHHNITQQQVTELINSNELSAQKLMKNKVGISVKKLMLEKRLLEGKRALAFTDKNVQEVAYDLGYKDPAYFNRLFTQTVGTNPKEFRKTVDFKHRDSFVEDILELLKMYHKEHHSIGFYSDKMNLSVKTLSKKVKSRLSTSLGQLIREEIVHSAKQMLMSGESVKQVSQALHFEEISHFSSFFKHYTAQSPSDFADKKYN